MTPTPQYASFSQRLLAFLLDAFIIALPVFTITVTFATPAFFHIDVVKLNGVMDFETLYEFYKNGAFICLTGFIAVSFILAVFVTSHWQATPGQRLVNIYIAARNGTKTKFYDAFGRFISLPLFLLMVGTFERRENYAVFDELKRAGKGTADFNALQHYFGGPVSRATGIIEPAVIALWFMLIFFTPEKTAMHDKLFNTRVFKGKK